jgi:formylglycine-generating enzyme required for sulfatase activity
MVVLPPGEFLMGEGKAQRPEKIVGSFALAAKKVTVAEFRRFRKDHQYQEQYAPTADCPVNSVSWYDAAEYCNWLSKEERIPDDQWCYLPIDKKAYAAGMTMAPDWPKRTGYRLPTEAEFEYAWRAGTVTRWHCGEADELLTEYAWYIPNSSDRPHPGGLKKPNEFGLFDIHGNTWDWCNNDLRKRNGEEVMHNSGRPLRGGAFNSRAMGVRSAERAMGDPGYRNDVFGLRPARVLH